MKISTSPAVLLCLSLITVLTAPMVRAQSSSVPAGITVNRINYFHQMADSTVTALSLPFSFNFQIGGTSTNMSAWGPAFYKPGSGGTPQNGSSTATNTGTLNFSSAPNNGAGYIFSHDFATNADLAAVYPTGSYGVKFLGTTPPSPAQFTAGLQYATGTYPSAAPQITAADNGAAWSSGVLRLKSTGTTTLSLSDFPEYGSTTYGSLMAVGIYEQATGNVIGSANLEAYYLPTFSPVRVDPKLTQVTINGAWLIPGVRYTMEIQYGILASPPSDTTLNGEPFRGIAGYRKNTTVTLMVPNSTGTDFNADGQSDILWRETSTGRVIVWLMNGTTRVSYTDIATVPAWQIANH